MPRHGSMILSDARGPTLGIAGEPADGAGGTTWTELMAENGDAKLTDLLVKLVDCPMSSVSI